MHELTDVAINLFHIYFSSFAEFVYLILFQSNLTHMVAFLKGGQPFLKVHLAVPFSSKDLLKFAKVNFDN